MSTVEIVEDLVSQERYETEWWYYHGYLRADEREFAFHVAFFRSSTEDVRIGSVFPLRWLAGQTRFSHFGLTDITRRRFRYGHQRSMFNHGGTRRDRYHVWIRDWAVEANDEGHRVSVTLDDLVVDLRLSPIKPAVAHRVVCGLCDGPGLPARYWSYPRMEAHGRLTADGRSADVSGTAWMDRAYGRLSIGRSDIDVEGWDWFGIQLDDGRDLMLHRPCEVGGTDAGPACATLIGENNEVEYLQDSDVSLVPQSYWTSRRTGVRYPVAWNIRAPKRGINLTVTPILRNQELDTRGTTCLAYWEGPSEVVGTMEDSAVGGRCFMELVGYDRRRRLPGCYDFRSANLSWLGFLNNEIRFWGSRGGTVAIEEEWEGARSLPG
jgi:predicted secreted hydrolase